MPEWSNTWEYPDKNNPETILTFIKCMGCKKSMLVKYKDNHKCPTEQPEPPTEKQQSVGEFKKASDRQPVLVEDDVELIYLIKQLIEGKPGRDLSGEEHAWVSTIFIQRKRM